MALICMQKLLTFTMALTLNILSLNNHVIFEIKSILWDSFFFHLIAIGLVHIIVVPEHSRYLLLCNNHLTYHKTTTILLCSHILWIGSLGLYNGNGLSLFHRSQAQLGNLNCVVVTQRAGNYNYLEAFSLACLAPGLEWLKHWSRMGLLTCAPTSVFSVWLGLPQIMVAWG